MTGDTLVDQAMRIRYDLTAAQAKLTDLIETIAALNLDTAKRPRAGSPRELHPNACPGCEVWGTTNGKIVHAADCPTLTA